MGTQNQLFKDGVNKLSAVMDQVKFDGSLSPQECDKIRNDIYQARSNIAAVADVHQDTTGQFKVALDMANLLEKAIDAVDDTKNLI